METIIALLIIYYVFSLWFMIGFALESGESNLIVVIIGYILILLLSPILFPINLGCFVRKNM